MLEVADNPWDSLNLDWTNCFISEKVEHRYWLKHTFVQRKTTSNIFYVL